MNRGSTVAALLATAALTLAACGGGGVDTDPGAAAADPNTVSGTITWWDTSDATNEAPAFRELVRRFEEKYPKIDVEYANVPFDGADDKFRTAAQNGNGAPDVMRADIGWTPTFAKLGYLYPLDGTPALAGAEDYLPVAAESTKLDGRTYGVPQVTDTLGLMYNEEHFAKAGITEPPRTWDELRTVALRLKDANPGGTGLFLHADSYYLLPFVYGEGGDYVDMAGKRITLDSEPVRKAIATVQDLMAAGAVTTDTSANGYTNMQNAFKSGTASMVLNGPWSVADYLTGQAFTDPANLGVAPVPAGPHGQGGPVGGHNLVVYAGSPNVAAALLFVEFVNSAESQRYVAEQNNTMPTRQSVYDTPEVAGNSTITAFQEPLRGAEPRPGAPGAGDLYDLFTPFYQQILGGQASVPDALGQAQRKAADAVPGFDS
ncbi:arabinogalactan oligomer / maltooligosaccharide transport system substrate-binding protein [Amycolatopsis arida]|uniref:Arabinogalactan oligomer / maltooligosaccharide transport system substrate-binding protein n=1 Tax=Amycolatopsis arida TaxID=587909 RepID=A0A1I5TH50_9PSEU|nr:extracellular solute-binding protein [Amycolatopsis arida]TDX96094.1 arabinogalactan oligomer/maltooligosaccharide transport system substrate-binding protein [Amycolatopsis arida]SFP82379.1 arabinogalactan oligomer / maltooligosaccharide transport system substrate-binding protein [Amycolatopsis arida]